MSIIKELSSSPYFDDFTPEQKDFLRILFRPGYAVQARELNQLQSILQTQIERFGKHIFAEGALIIGGQTTIDAKTSKYLKIKDSRSDESTPIILSHFFNKMIYGQTSGALGYVVVVEEKVGSDPYTLIFKPLNGKFFEQNENIDIVDYNTNGSGSLVTLDSGAGKVVNLSNFYGNSSTVSISSGIFFNRGMFVICPEQTATIEKYSDTPTKKVGLFSNIQLITPDDDLTLLDNANGSYNYAAPGAHRLKVNLTLRSVDFNFTEDSDKFIELLHVREGKIYKQVSKTKYSELGKTLARRTFDESGNYTVKPFILSVKDHPTDPSKLQLAISPGKAYIRGFEFETIATEFLDLPKARTTEAYTNYDIFANYDNYVIVEIERGLPNIQSFGKVFLFNATNTNIGSANVRSIKLHQSGTTPRYKLYLFNINLLPTYSITNLKRIQESSTYSGSSLLSLVLPIQEEGKLYFPSSQGLVFPTGFDFVSSINNIQLEYNVFFENVVVSGGTTATIQTPKTNGTERFGPSGTMGSSLKEERFIIIKNNRTLVPYSDFSVVLDSPGPNSPQTATITFTNNPGSPITIIARVTNNNAVPNTKTKVKIPTSMGIISENASNTTIIKLEANETAIDDFYRGGKILLRTDGESTIVSIVDSPGAYNGITKELTLATPVTVTKSTFYIISPKFTANENSPNRGIIFISSPNYTQKINLDCVDAIRAVKIINKSSGNITMDDWFDQSKDVTYKFNLNDGQTETHYDRAYITLKPEFAGTLSGPLMIFVEYYNHTINDGFFCKTSYPNSDELNPFNTTNGIIDLKNCIDFRPSLNLTTNNFRTSKLIISNTPIDLTIEYYLGRIDKLICLPTGEFSLLSGLPSIHPKPPKDIEEAMTIYVISIDPYTLTKENVRLQYIENKRYTMRDIGKLERRIENLEYYTSLSALESSTASFEVKDPNGNTRFKNGFIVDTFNGHNIGNVADRDYKCSIDPIAGELRPSFIQNGFGLYHLTSSNIIQTGKLAHLNYTSFDFINQPLASRWINANPYAVFTWRGKMTLSPSSDFWKDIKTRPANIINLTGTLDNVQFGNQPFSSNFNDWNTNWGGQSSTIEEVEIEPNWFVYNRIQWLGGVPLDVRDLAPTISPGLFVWTNPITGQPSPTPLYLILDRNGNTVGVYNSGFSGLSGPETAIRTVRQRTVSLPPTIQSGNSTQTIQIRATGSSSENFVVSVDYQPFIRTREITFSASGLKPNTIIYPFFDETLVSQHCRMVNGSFGGQLVTSANGTISGVFRIPANSFLVGDRIFRLTDSNANNKSLETTFAETRYTAFGLQETSTVLNVNVNVEIRSTPSVQQAQAQLQTISNPWPPTNLDPLAQDFIVDKDIYPFGVFIHSVDIFFKTKDNVVPISLQIREMKNGYPGQKILAETIKQASDVNVSENGTVPTTFTFSELVYLEPGGNYCIVLPTSSKNYNVWVAQIGDNEITNNALISEQPNVGSLFLSQNAYTWTADQTKDLKFKIRGCLFTTGSYEIILTDWKQTEPDNFVVLKTIKGTTTGNVLYIERLHTFNVVIGSKVTGTNIPANTTVIGTNYFENTVTLSNSISGNIPSGTNITFFRKRESMPIVTKMNLMNLNPSVFCPFSSASCNYSVATTPLGGSIETNFIPILPNKNFSFSSQREIGVANESVRIKISGTNDNKYVTPIFNMERMNFIAVENIINDDTTGETNAYGGNATAKYVTRKIVLDDPSVFIKVYLTAYRPSGTDVHVYYKTNKISSNTPFEENSWVLMNKDYNITKYSMNENEFIEYSFSSDPTIDPFTELAIKIVMTSNNNSVVPRVSDFRAIALE